MKIPVSPGPRWARTGRLTGQPWEIVRVTEDGRAMLLTESAWLLADSIVEWGPAIASPDEKPAEVAFLPINWRDHRPRNSNYTQYHTACRAPGLGPDVQITVYNDDLFVLDNASCPISVLEILAVLRYHYVRRG